MPRLLLILACVCVLACCSGANTSMNTLQLAGTAEPFPDDYPTRALRYLGEDPAAGVMVSYPQTTLGDTVFSARRWYVCLSGITPPGPAPKGAKPLFEAAADLTQANAGRGIYHVILILRANGAVSAIKGYDSPLCRDARYQALTAA